MNTRKLTESALLIGVATLLSVFPTLHVWANGGSVTICSMLPLLVIAYRYGTKWGLLSSTAYALLQLILGPPKIAAGEFLALILCVILDYFLAFGVLGLSGIFKKVLPYPAAFLTGTAFCIVLRFLCHFLSGVVVWGSLTSVGDWQYSFIYNGSYMLPELIITLVGASVVGVTLKKQLFNQAA